jgi:hypothetical protein
MYDKPNPTNRIIIVACALLLLIVIALLFPAASEKWLITVVGLVIIELIVHLFIWPHWYSKAKLNLDQQFEQRYSQLHDDIQAVTDLSITASAAGLSKIYSSRKDAIPDILHNLRSCKDSICVLGITLSKDMKLNSILNSLKRPLGDTADVRIMLFHPLCSPALIRSLIEASAENAKEMIAMPNNSSNDHVYFRSNLFNDANNAINDIKEHLNPTEYHCVRFYRHYPTAWLIIVGQTAYYQPYLLCNFKNNSAITSFDKLPVFRFERSLSPIMYDFLQEHFDTKWKTSSVDLFHMDNWLMNKMYSLKHILKKRKEWLIYSYDELHGQYGRRHYPRQGCTEKLKVVSMNSTKGMEITAKIKNYSADGLQLELIAGPEPEIGEKMQFRIANAKKNSELHDHIRRKVFEANHRRNDYSVIWKKDKLIGLHRVA